MPSLRRRPLAQRRLGLPALENADGGKRRELVRHDPAGGEARCSSGPTSSSPRARRSPLGIADFAVSDDGRRLLLFTNTRKVWRLNTRGDYWVFDRGREVAPEARRQGPRSLADVRGVRSPRASSVAYVRDNNLYVEDVGDRGDHPADQGRLGHAASTARSTGSTRRSSSLRDGFRWSPDGRVDRLLADRHLGRAGIPDARHRRRALSQGRPGPLSEGRARRTRPRRVGVVPASGGETRWIEIPGDPRENYIARMEWVPDSDELVIQQLNRRQDTARGDARRCRDGRRSAPSSPTGTRPGSTSTTT